MCNLLPAYILCVIGGGDGRGGEGRNKCSEMDTFTRSGQVDANIVLSREDHLLLFCPLASPHNRLN